MSTSSSITMKTRPTQQWQTFPPQSTHNSSPIPHRPVPSRPLVAMNMSTPPPSMPSKQQWYTSPPRPRISRMLFFVSPLMLAFSITIGLFIIEQLTISILNAHKNFDDITFTTYVYVDGQYDLPLIAVNSTPTAFMVWTSAVSAILSIIAGLAFWELRSAEGRVVGRERRAKAWAWANVMATQVNLAVVIACTVVAFLAQKSDDDEGVRQAIGRQSVVGTRETILCGLKRVSGRRWASAGCGFAITGRWTLVPLGVCSLALVGLCFWQIVERGGVKLLFGVKKQDEQSGSDMEQWVSVQSSQR